MCKALSINSLKPDLFYERLTDIPFQILLDWKVKGIIMDVDNTLLSKTSQKPDKDVLDWVLKLKQMWDVIIVSNNIPSKIQRASNPLDLPYIAWTIKPLPWYFTKALKRLKMKASEVCVIGDQIFTDILGGKLIGAKTIYVRPINLAHEMLWTKGMRIIERKVIKQWTTTL